MTTTNPINGWINNGISVGGQLGQSAIYVVAASGANPSITIDWNNGLCQFLDLGSCSGTPVIGFGNLLVCDFLSLKIKNHGTTPITSITYTGAGSSVLFEGAINPNPTNAINAIDWLIGICDGTNTFYSIRKGFA